MATTAKLNGSEKQVEWAQTIRAEKIATIEAMIAKGNAQIETLSGEARVKAEQSRAEVLRLVAKLEQVQSPQFWIDARADNVQMLMQSARTL
jgi:hypothetical protein